MSPQLEDAFHFLREKSDAIQHRIEPFLQAVRELNDGELSADNAFEKLTKFSEVLKKVTVHLEVAKVDTTLAAAQVVIGDVYNDDAMLATIVVMYALEPDEFFQSRCKTYTSKALGHVQLIADKLLRMYLDDEIRKTRILVQNWLSENRLDREELVKEVGVTTDTPRYACQLLEIECDNNEPSQKKPEGGGKVGRKKKEGLRNLYQLVLNECTDERSHKDVANLLKGNKDVCQLADRLEKTVNENLVKAAKQYRSDNQTGSENQM